MGTSCPVAERGRYRPRGCRRWTQPVRTTAAPFGTAREIWCGCPTRVRTGSRSRCRSPWATAARVTAIDTRAGAPERSRNRVAAQRHGDRGKVRNAEMAQLAVPDRPRDVIRAEGSASIRGAARALRDGRPPLRPGGVPAVAQMVLRTETPPEALRALRASDRPDGTCAPDDPCTERKLWRAADGIATARTAAPRET